MNLRLLVIVVLSISIVVSSCSFTKKIKDGTMAYELKQYAVATEMLEEEYKKSSDERAKARLAFLIGEAYWKMGEAEQALPWYSKAEQNKFGPRALEKKAYTLKSLEQYDQAIGIFRVLLTSGTQLDEYRKEIAICGLAKEWKNADFKKYEVERGLFNSRSSDYCAVFMDSQHVIFSSDRASSSNSEAYNWTGRNFSDLYIYNEITGEVSQLDPVINSKNNEGSASFSADGTEIYFTRCYTEKGIDDYCKILKSTFDNGSWSPPIVLPFVMEEINYGHPFWSEEQSVLFYSSEQTAGYGGFDIYFARLDTSGVWSEPKVLSQVINTIGDEKFPTVKGDTLFFSSDGHLGMGGLDIFYSYIDEAGNWTIPKNMKSPINGGSDDFGIVFEKDGGLYKETGYFTSSRSGIDNIYSFSRSKKSKPDIKTEEPNDEDKDKFLKLAITILVEDEEGNKKPFPLAKLMVNGKRKNLNKKAFVFENIVEGNYSLQVSYPKYFAVRTDIDAQLSDVPNGKNEYTYNKTLIMKPIIANKEIVLENIFYDFNKYFIRDDAKPSLVELASLLTENPEISIELSSHTDCRGPDKYNQSLSQERAQAAVEYIIGLGIASSRIVARGYGESIPKAGCECDTCSEEEHQLNRRTSFKILSVGGE